MRLRNLILFGFRPWKLKHKVHVMQIIQAINFVLRLFANEFPSDPLYLTFDRINYRFNYF